MSLRISGNRVLQTLPGLATRPTPARVRQALFNILQGEIAGSRWLDLCAGVGSVGAEALCRGCASLVGIEESAGACKVITTNWQRVAQPEQRIRVLRGDARQVLPRLVTEEGFDFIYLDPPYESSLYEDLLPLLPPLLDPQGVLIVEHRVEKCCRHKWESLRLMTSVAMGRLG